MRKKTTKNWWDTTFWYIIYMLPIIIALFGAFNAFGVDGLYSWVETDGDWSTFPLFISLRTMLDTWGFQGNSFIGDALRAIFDADGGYFPVIYDAYSWVYLFAEYFVTMVAVHLMIDFILFIPRFAHKIMDKCYQDD